MFFVDSSLVSRILRPWHGVALAFLVFFGPFLGQVAAVPAAPTNLKVAITIPSSATKTYLSTNGPRASLYNQVVQGTLISNTAPVYSRMFNLTWQNHATDADFIEISMQVLDSVSGHTNYSWVPITYLNSSTASFSWDFPFFNNNGTAIQFRVTACNGTVDNTTGAVTVNVRSVPSEASVPYVASPSSNSLTTPVNLQAAIVTGTDGQIRFTWSDVNDSEEGYQLFVREHNDTTPNNWPSSPQATLPFGSGADVTVANLVAGKTYDMKIRAERATAYQSTSPYSATTFETTGDSNVVTLPMPGLSAPSGLTATGLTETTLRLGWTINSTAADDYEVQYSVDNTSYSNYPLNGTLGRSQTVDLFWFPNSTVYFKVVAVQHTKDSQGTVVSTQRSSPSAATSITLTFNPATNLTVTYTTDPQTLHTLANLAWADHSLVETGYEVLIRPSTGSSSSFTPVLNVPTPNATTAQVDVTSFLDAATPYDFSVEAVYDNKDNQGNVVNSFTSANSNVVSSTFDGITSAGYAPITYLKPFSSYTLVASTIHSTVKSMTVTGLPPGLGFNASAGSSSGVVYDVLGTGPKQAGLFLCPMTVTYNNGWVNRKTLALRVVRPPAPPILPTVITTRKVPTGVTNIPLSELVQDPDSESAVRLNTNLGVIDIVLQPTLTPATVTNFMAYANAGDYNGTVFHRLSPGFVIQGGGYKPAATPDHFVEVTRRSSPINEPGISNVRGTIALAKAGTPNSGTHDFFINLSDNNTANLDSNTGGFTVFGRVTNLTPDPTTVSSPSNTFAVQVTPVVDIIQALYTKGSGAYAINLLGSGATSETTNYKVFGDDPSGLGSGTIWPLTENPATMDNTKCVVINTVTNLPVLSYSVTSTNPGNVDVQTSGGNLVLTGLVDGGQSKITLEATDVENHTVSQTFDVTVTSGYQVAQIGTQPTDVTPKEGDTASLHVTATGENLHYQWRKAGVNIDGTANATALTDTLELTNVGASDAGDYQVHVSNDATLVLSATAHVNVLLKPRITTQPANITVNYYKSATFTVVTTSDSTQTYQWLRNDNKTALSSFHEISGATGPTYTIPRTYMADNNTLYEVRVTNSGGTIFSNSATLTVKAVDTDGDGLTDDQELLFGTSATNADTDGDGYSDSVEISLGTDPRVSSSTPGKDYFVSRNDGGTALTSLTMKSIPGVATFRNPLDNFNGIPVPQQWMAATEMTNDQFATVLEIALNKMHVIEIVADGSRRFVRYPKTSGQTLCYLAPLPSDTSTGTVTPPSCDVGADQAGTTFYVPKTLAKMPVRAVSWYAAYLATAALNDFYGYTSKCTSNWTYDSTKPGYSIPTYTAWDWAAGTGAQPYPLYPTGATISLTQANYGNTSPNASPKAVGSYAASKLGLFDMGGNVAEWIFDQTTSPSTTGYVRGGNFSSPSTDVLNTARQPLTRESLSNQVGFRLAMKEDPAPHDLVVSPTDQFVQAGTTVVLSVTAQGAPPMTYQWYKDKVALKGMTGSQLTISAATAANAGKYSVMVISNGAGSKMSTDASVSVVSLAPYGLVSAPNTPATFKAVLSSPYSSAFTFEWHKVVGSVLSNTIGVSANYTIDVPTFAHDGVYRCIVTPPAGKAGLSPVTMDGQRIVQRAPAVLSSLAANIVLPTGVVGGSYNINPLYGLFDGATDRRATSYSASNLPAGMSIDPKTGTITGRPTVSSPDGGYFSVSITATNSQGSATVTGIKLQVLAIPPAAVGTWVGSVTRQSTLNGNLGGRLDLTCTATGTYTGKVTLGGDSYPIKDFLGGTVSNGAAGSIVSSTVVIPRAGKSTLYLSFNADVSSASHALAGTIGEIPAGTTTVINLATVSGWRRLDYASATASLLSRNGYHTLSLEPPTGSTDPTQVPQGTSFVTASVADVGDVVQAGRLADGMALSCTSPMSSTGEVMMFNTLYSLRGSLLGSYVIASGHGVSLGTQGMGWYKMSTTDRNYKTGFGPLSLIFGSGGLYTPPAGVPVMGLADSGPFTYNAKAVFTGGALVAPTTFSQTFRITDASATIFDTGLAFNPYTVGGKVDKVTGIFSGTFVAPGTPTRSGTWYGVITPKKGDPSKKSAYGAFQLPQVPGTGTTATTSPILSGTLVVQPNP